MTGNSGLKYLSEVRAVKNLEQVAQESKKGLTPIYYSFAEDAVYTEQGKGRFYVTDLIRENTVDEIRYAIRRWMAM